MPCTLCSGWYNNLKIFLYWGNTVDYKDFVDSFKRVACVISVDLKGEKGDDYRYLIVEANEAYKRTVVKDIADFKTGVPYTRYIMKTANFENLCDTCVTSNVPIHTYFDIELYNAWMEVFLMPLESGDPDMGMLLFSYEMNPKADIDKLADHLIRDCDQRYQDLLEAP